MHAGWILNCSKSSQGACEVCTWFTSILSPWEACGWWVHCSWRPFNLPRGKGTQGVKNSVSSVPKQRHSIPRYARLYRMLLAQLRDHFGTQTSHRYLHSCILYNLGRFWSSHTILTLIVASPLQVMQEGWRAKHSESAQAFQHWPTPIHCIQDQNWSISAWGR